jgi:hypothetical protein
MKLLISMLFITFFISCISNKFYIINEKGIVYEKTKKGSDCF